MTLYRAPADLYSERQEANDPDPKLRSPWDGCWTWTIARALDAATGGRIHGLGEDDIRAAAGKPDVPGADGGYLEDQVKAIVALAPGLWFQARPTLAAFQAHLSAGGIAVMAGWESDAPASDRRYDVRFYDNKGANAHSIYTAGIGGVDGSGIIWGNPEKFLGEPEPIVGVSAAVKFVWDARSPAGCVEAILFRSVEKEEPVPQFLPVGNPIGVVRVDTNPLTRALNNDLAVIVLPGSDALVYAEANIPGHAIDGTATSAAYVIGKMADGSLVYLLKRNSTVYTPIGAADATYLVHLAIANGVPSISLA